MILKYFTAMCAYSLLMMVRCLEKDFTQKVYKNMAYKMHILDISL